MTGEMLLAASLLSGLAASVFHLMFHRRPLYLNPLAVVADGPLPRIPPVQIMVSAVAVVAVFCFGGRATPLLASTGALVAIRMIRHWEIETWPDNLVVRVGKYAPASACLLGWLVASMLTRLLAEGVIAERAHAWEAAAGVLGGCYFLSAIAKLRASGWAWARAEHMSLLLAERGFGPFGGLRLRLAQSRLACTAIGVTGLGVELAGPLLVWGPARFEMAMVLVGFKLFTWLFFGYFEPEWALAAAAVGVGASN